MAARPIAEAFAEFDDNNPHVYVLFRRFARRAKGAGLTRYSADAILHRLRWHLDIEVVRNRDKDGNPEPFKINNNFAAHYARKMMRLNPSFNEFFETRVLRNGGDEDADEDEGA